MRILLLFLPVFFLACSNEKSSEKNDIAQKKDSLVTSGEKSGILGVYSIPETICLSIKDTAKISTVDREMGEDFNALQQDVAALKIPGTGPQGVILYTNSPDNFVFRCILPINGMPAAKPQHSELFVLEGTRAVLYNYFGSYSKMTNAYNELKKYIAENKLTQTAPAREFYITDPLIEKDTAKWLSKIYVPVK